MHSPIITPAQMRAAEEAAFARGVSAEKLMEQAGEGIARAIGKFFPCPGKGLVFAGKGHNAGDAFVAARRLAESGWEMEVRLSYPEEELTALTKKKLRQLKIRKGGSSLSPVIVLDGLLGLGARPPLRQPILGACREINSLGKMGAHIFAIDLPSGLDGDSGKSDPDAVRANFTLTVACAKSGLVADDAIDFVGRLEVIPLEELQPKKSANLPGLAVPEILAELLPPRKFSAYKNQFGRIGIVAGSRGFTGAAVMSSLGSLRAGGGLVELFIPEKIYPIVAAAAAPEVMVKPVKSYANLLDEPVDIWAIGPGLGQKHAPQILGLIRNAKQPMVVDADALNILSRKIKTLAAAKGPRLLTPHPGEMQRLFPETKKLSRAAAAKKFSAMHSSATLLFKGSRTIVATTGQPLSYNTTGNPGMATGGMGDVLTGVCAALLGAKLSPHDAARLGAWVCGRAAELAIFRGDCSEESLLPTDLLAHLGAAFRDLRDQTIASRTESA